MRGLTKRPEELFCCCCCLLSLIWFLPFRILIHPAPHLGFCIWEWCCCVHMDIYMSTIFNFKLCFNHHRCITTFIKFMDDLLKIKWPCNYAPVSRQAFIVGLRVKAWYFSITYMKWICPFRCIFSAFANEQISPYHNYVFYPFWAWPTVSLVHLTSR
jgi:hypothetical protein